MPVGVNLVKLNEEQKWEAGDKLLVTLGDWDPIKPEEQNKTYEITFDHIRTGADNMMHAKDNVCWYLNGLGQHAEYGEVTFSFHDYVIKDVKPADAEPVEGQPSA